MFKLPVSFVRPEGDIHMHCRKNETFFLLLSILIFLFSNPASGIEETGYDISLNSFPTVMGKGDGINTVCDFFSLYRNGLPYEDISQLTMNVYEDDIPVQHHIDSGKKTVDIVFCMDVSGSMDYTINGVKTNTESFVNALVKNDYFVRLGLITFGHASSPYLRIENNGDFYPNPDDFLGRVKELIASGGDEEWFDAVVYASQYPFSPSALRVVILITDETGDTRDYTYPEALNIVKSNSAIVYSITESNVSTSINIAEETNGTVYNITAPFNEILYNIADKVVNSFSLCFDSAAFLGAHDLTLEIENNQRSDTVAFTIGENPVIDLEEGSVKFDGEKFSARAQIEDPDGHIDYAKVSMIFEDGSSLSEKMVNDSGNEYSFDYKIPDEGHNKVAFSIQAVDNEGKSSISGPWAHTLGKEVPSVKTAVFIQNPKLECDGKDQPVGIGSILDGGDHMDFTVNFPAYYHPDKTPAKMNYYIAVALLEPNGPAPYEKVFFLTEGGLHLESNLMPYQTELDDVRFTHALQTPVFDYFKKGSYHLHALAVESKHDPGHDLDFLNRDVPYDLWSFGFEISDSSYCGDIHATTNPEDFLK